MADTIRVSVSRMSSDGNTIRQEIQQFPDAAAKLFVQQEEDAKERMASYKKMAAQ